MNGFDGRFYSAIHTDSNGNKTVINIGMSHKQSKEMERNKRLASLFDQMQDEMKEYEKPKPKKSWLSKIWPFCILILFASCATKSDIEKAHIRIDSLNKRLVAAENENLFLRAELDSMHSFDKVAYLTLSKHDSAINERQFKRDRAERRGLFWGGVAKSVIGK